MKLYAAGGDIYAQFGTSVLRWRRQGGSWKALRADLPSGARPIGFAELPEELREEVLAAAARAEAAGSPGMGGNGR